MIARATDALAGRLALLGLPPRDYGDTPAWHVDPISSRQSPRAPWLRVPYLDVDQVGDHKAVWELNRHQWLVWLAQGFVLTGDERFADAALHRMRHWVEQNPVRIGINWVSSLELSFRVIQWTAVLHLLQHSRARTAEHVRPLLASLEAQVQHVSTHLSTWFAPNTHLTGEALGLIVAGTAFPSLRGASAHVHAGRAILEEEAQRQIRDDGGYFEQSAWYQAYTVDIFIEAARWLDFAGLPLGQATHDRIRRSAHFLAHCCRPDGSLIRYGDDDGGSLWRVGLGAMHAGTLARAAAYLNDPSLSQPQGSGPSPDLFLNASGQSSAAPVSATSPFPAIWVAPQSGLLRIDDDADNAIVLDAGPHGAYGHPHADALAIDLTIGGIPVVVDPGTGSYFGDVRQRLRETRAHATLEVDAQCTSAPGGSFGWKRGSDAHIVRSGRSDWGAWAEGALPASPGDGRHHTHVRTVLRLPSRAWIVLDHMRSPVESAQHRAVLRWTFAPDLSAQITPAGMLCQRDSTPVALLVTDDPARTSLSTGLFSAAYGHVSTSQVGERTTTFSIRADVCTVIGEPALQMSLTRDESGLPFWRYRDVCGELIIAQPRGIPVPLNGTAIDGDWAILIASQPAPTLVVAGPPSLHHGTRIRLAEEAGDVRRFAIDETF